MITSFFKPKRGRAAATTAGKENTGKDEIQQQQQQQQQQQHQNKKQKKETPQDVPETTKSLISYLNDNGTSDDSSTETTTATTLPTWKSALDKHFSSPSFRRLASFVDAERYVFFSLLHYYYYYYGDLVGCLFVCLFVRW